MSKPHDSSLEQILSTAEYLLKSGNKVELKVSGLSMFPFLLKGDLIQVFPTPLNELRRGDIIVFKRENRWIAHRVFQIQMMEGKVTLKTYGDTCYYPDEGVSSVNYLGRVDAFTRKGTQIALNSYKRKMWTQLILVFNISYRLPWYSGILLGRMLKRILKR
jgi:signal peptidase I